jgi:NitT/TauT family transport system substrate-binding protein
MNHTSKYGADQVNSRIRAICLTLAVSLAAIGSANAQEKISLGLVGGGGNAGFFIAASEGYFKAEGLDVTLVPFDAGAKMIPLLGSGQLDVAAGSASASLYNAAARQVPLKIVAGFAQTATNNPYYSMVVKSDLIDSGKFKTYADLKNFKIALNAPGVSATSVLNEAAKLGGLSYDSLNIVYLGFPQQIAAMQNGAIDVTVTIEPFLTSIVSSGVGKIYKSVDEFYPKYQIGLVFFGEAFMKRRAVAVKFLRAYARGTQMYQKVVHDGRFVAGPDGDKVVSILSTHMNMTEANIRRIYAPSNTLELNLESLRKDIEFMKARGDVTDKTVAIESLVDLSMLQEAQASMAKP